jgi:carboxyl-terminal processing protease
MDKQIMISRRTLYFFVLCTVLSFGLTLNLVRQVAAKEDADKDPLVYLKNLTDVISLVQKNYVREVKFTDLVDGAIKGMLMTLDPHSSYLPPEGFSELKVETKGEFGGLGIEITVRDGLLTVVSPIEDSPAARVGIQSGDQIIKIGEEFTRELSLSDAVKKMRGPKGTPVTLHIHREGYRELIPVTVVRDIIKVRSIRSRALDSGVGFIRVTQFQEETTKEFKAALKELGKKTPGGLKGLVIDLRNNPGGLLNQAVRLGDVFLKDGLVVYTDGRLESQKQKFSADNDGDEPTYPVVVLINGGSASASEIVAGSLQDAGVALVVGTQSFGKGSVQTILPMDSGAAVRLTTALYYTRSGRSIQAQGITPDITVQPKPAPALKPSKTPDPGLRVKESDLPGAIKNPRDNGEIKPQEDELIEEEQQKLPIRDMMKVPLNELLQEDPQLEAAHRLIKEWIKTGVKP